MKYAIKDFFTKLNGIKIVESADYTNIELLKNTATAISRATGSGIYIFDYFRQNLLFVSDNIMQWCKLLPISVKRDGYEAFLKYIPEEDLQMLIDINDAAFEFWNTHKEISPINYVLSYDFRFGINMVHQTYTPIVIKGDRIWLAMCIASFSSQTKPGNIVMNHEDKSYEYSLTDCQWHVKEAATLTDREKESSSFNFAMCTIENQCFIK